MLISIPGGSRGYISYTCYSTCFLFYLTCTMCCLFYLLLSGFGLWSALYQLYLTYTCYVPALLLFFSRGYHTPATHLLLYTCSCLAAPACYTDARSPYLAFTCNISWSKPASCAFCNCFLFQLFLAGCTCCNPNAHQPYLSFICNTLHSPVTDLHLCSSNKPALCALCNCCLLHLLLSGFGLCTPAMIMLNRIYLTFTCYSWQLNTRWNSFHLCLIGICLVNCSVHATPGNVPNIQFF